MSVCPPVHDVCTTSYLRAWVIKLLLVGDHRPSACMFQPNSYITNTTIIHLWQIESGLAKLYVRKKATCVQIIPWYIGWETFQTSLKDVWEQMYNYGEDHNGKLLFNHKQEEHNKQKLGKLLTIMIPALLSLSFFVDSVQQLIANQFICPTWQVSNGGNCLAIIKRVYHGPLIDLLTLGSPLDTYAFHGELQGLHALFLMVQWLCSTHQITPGALPIGCNNQAGYTADLLRLPSKQVYQTHRDWIYWSVVFCPVSK